MPSRERRNGKGGRGKGGRGKGGRGKGGRGKDFATVVTRSMTE